jgi:lipoprotein-anchoring transpeptidase ErfK/SrfK
VPVVGVLSILGLLGSCTGERPSLGVASAGSAPATSTTSTTVAPTSTTVAAPRTFGPDELLGFIATPNGRPEVYETADATAPRISVPPPAIDGVPPTFAIVGDPTQPDPKVGDWVEVLLPTRPNGSTGWVTRSSIAITQTPFKVFVELEARRLRVERGGVQAFTAEIAVGTADNPTPTGGTYVTELIENIEPAGAYGPFAFGLALHSDTLTEFNGGPGQVGIHGTNTPAKIGQAVSHGCVRLRNEDIRAVVDLDLPLGVPVFIS